MVLFHFLNDTKIFDYDWFGEIYGKKKIFIFKFKKKNYFTGQMDSQQNLGYQVMENNHHQFYIHINE